MTKIIGTGNDWENVTKIIWIDSDEASQLDKLDNSQYGSTNMAATSGCTQCSTKIDQIYYREMSLNYWKFSRNKHRSQMKMKSQPFHTFSATASGGASPTSYSKRSIVAKAIVKARNNSRLHSRSHRSRMYINPWHIPEFSASHQEGHAPSIRLLRAEYPNIQEHHLWWFIAVRWTYIRNISHFL